MWDRATLDNAVNELSARGRQAVRGRSSTSPDAAAILGRFRPAWQPPDGGLDAAFANAGITGSPGFLSVFGGRDPEGAIGEHST